MKTKRILFIILPLLALYLSACVPSRKLDEAEAKYKACDAELKALRDSTRKFFDEHKEMQSELTRLKKATDALSRDTSILGASYRQMREQYDKINKLNDEIMKKLELLQKGSELESSKLSAQLEATRLELQKKEDDLKMFERELNVKKQELDLKTKELADKEKRIRELEDVLARQEAASKALKEKVANALLAFKDKGLTVEQKNGRVYVSMEAKLLFASGSYKVDQEGKEALIKLAKILEDQKDIEVQVEGHTDTDKLNSPNVPRDNWELSVLRATSVVKLMMENSKMDPKRITAAGRSEFLPVDPNDKSKNRRIEIILIPNLDELYKAIQN
ncbi:MAG: OmpA family protein [Flavobacteriales bacterium]|nr:OmpA family protein [Flavobacteriales bacterium]